MRQRAYIDAATTLATPMLMLRRRHAA